VDASSDAPKDVISLSTEHGLVKRPISQDGQDRPEDLILHDRIVPTYRIGGRLPFCKIVLHP
jgi:hypothetical protein